MSDNGGRIRLEFREEFGASGAHGAGRSNMKDELDPTSTIVDDTLLSVPRSGFYRTADGAVVPDDRAAALRWSRLVDETAARMRRWQKEHNSGRFEP
jgi:hypothetical protein